MLQMTLAKRPAMDIVLSEFEVLRKKMSKQKLDSKVIYTKDHLIQGTLHKLSLLLKHIL
jgi:hypothetical protein